MKIKWLTMLLSMGISLYGVTARANIDLKSWKSYGNLAEQGAICASFASLMESQSLLNPDMGRLWQERRKFSGAVIGKAVMLEFDKEIASEDIETFIAEYRDWVLAALMTSPETQPANPPQDSLELGQEKVASLIKTQCALLFKQGDAQIREKFPELAYLIASETRGGVDNINSQDKTENTALAGPRKTMPTPRAETPAAPPKSEPAPTKLANTDIKSGTKPDMKPAEEVQPEAKKAAKDAPITLALGSGISFSLTMPRSASSAGTTKTADKTDSAPEQAQAPKAPKSPENLPAENQLASNNVPLPVAPPERPSLEVATPAPQLAPKPLAVEQVTQLAQTEQTTQIEQTAQTKQTAQQKAVPANKAPVKRKPEPTAKPQPPAPPVLTLAQQQATPLILPVTLSLPALPEDDTKIAKIYASFGDFTDIAQAEQRKTLLESRFAKLFSAYQLQITAHDPLTTDGQAKSQPDSNSAQIAAPAYRLQTKSTLAVTTAQEICTLLWPHNVGCIVKAHYSS